MATGWALGPGPRDKKNPDAIPHFVPPIVAPWWHKVAAMALPLVLLFAAVTGKRHALQLVLAGMPSDGHVLIEDFPGVAARRGQSHSASGCSLFARSLTPPLVAWSFLGHSQVGIGGGSPTGAGRSGIRRHWHGDRWPCSRQPPRGKLVGWLA
ncbi:MAG: hypothetical protein ACYCS7_05845 [Acidimicrobiales bacterium]